MNWVKAIVLVALAAPAQLAAEEALKPAKIITVSSEPLVIERQFFGQVIARKSVDLAFQVPGQIVEFPVLEGVTIPQGGLIARLDLETFELQRNQARLQKEQADRTVERLGRLTGSTVSKVAVEDAETAAALALISLKNTEWALRNATLLAPFEGLISSRNADLFSTVNVGTPVVRIHDMSELRIEVDVPEILFQRAGDGDGIEISARFPAREGEFPLEIREFDAETSSIGQTFRITFGMGAPGDGAPILPGSSVTVTARLQQPREGISVPPTALVVSQKGAIGVMQFTATGSGQGEVAWVQVQTEPMQSGNVLVTSGLTDGTEIVATGGGALKDGQEVRRFSGFAN